MINFFLKYNKKFLDYDGVYGNQCVDVIKQYFQEVLGLPPFKGDAIDYWENPPEGFTKIAKTFYNHPEPGDLMIWSTAPYGHIAIVNWWRWFDVGVFEQNNPIGSPCHYGTHDYSKVLGWLRPNPVLQVAFCGGNPVIFIKKAKEYGITVKVNTYPAIVGKLTTDDAMKKLDELDLKEKFVYLHCDNTDYEVASFHPKRNQAFCTLPHGQFETVRIHAFLHLLRKYVNFNRIKPYVEDREWYPTSWSDAANFDNPGWRFKEQYKELLGHIPKIK
jgi:hypothetical protein